MRLPVLALVNTIKNFNLKNATTMGMTSVWKEPQTKVAAVSYDTDSARVWMESVPTEMGHNSFVQNYLI